MILSPYSTEKMYEFELREMDRTTREFWKWKPSRRPDCEPAKGNGRRRLSDGRVSR